jgi:gliding motility-associated-like protein
MMITLIMMVSAMGTFQAQCIPTSLNGFHENLMQATFHTVLYKTPNGYAASGEGTAPSGLDQPNIQEIINANGYTGIPAGTTLMWGSVGSHAQLVFLGDDNVIYAGGIEGLVLNPALTSSKVYQPIPLAMPTGVTYNDVVKFQAAAQVLMMVTSSGQIYLTGNNCGNVATPCNNLMWNLVSLPTGITPQIVDLTFRTIAMYGSDGNFYTRGTKNFIGNGTTWFSNAAAWTQMTVPPLSEGSQPVQLELGNLIDQNEVSYLVLDMDGTIHSMGNAPIIGNNSSASNTWTKVGQNCTEGVLQEVVFITASDNDYRNVGAGAILADGTIRLWGMDDNNMLAGASLVCPTEPCMDTGVTMDDMVYLENGTHLTPAISVAGLLCNVGHNSDGGFGDGTEDDRDCYECITLPTLPVLCVNGECGTDTLITATICNGQSYNQGNSVYTSSGSYVTIFESVQGCDSVVTLELTVTNSISSLNVVAICVGESYTEGSSTYTSTGTYTDFYATSEPGCDSVVTTELTVVGPISVTNMVVNCNGETYTEGSSVYSSTGIYTDQYQTAAGCDSIVTTDLTMSAEINVTNVVEICSGSSYVEGISTYNSTGIYINIYTSVTGCDSVVTTDLKVNSPIAITNTADICSGSSYTEGSSVYTEPGVYTDSYLTSSGCDSIVTTDLTVVDEISLTNVVSICEGSSYTQGSSVYSDTGIYTDEYSTASGCDSVVTTDLTVNAQIEVTNTVSICQGESYTEGPSAYSESGEYSETYQTTSGCDSIVHTLLTVHLYDETMNEVEICEGESYFEQSSEYTVSGTYTDLYFNAVGCDSVVITMLTIHPLANTVNEIDLCQGQVYQEGNSEYSESGTYNDSYQTTHGCDSIVTTVLTVLEPQEVTNEVSICEGEVYFEQDSAYSNTGTYMDSYQNTYGCDSTVITILTVNPLPIVLLDTEPAEGCESFEVTFENQANNTGDLSYAWSAGNGQTSTEESPTFTFSGTGSYFVTLSLTSASGCVSTTSGSQVVLVHSGPQASFTASEEETHVNTNIEFQSTSSADVVSYQWAFGDGSTGTASSISHSYTDIGTYDVTLAVTSEWGCQDEVTQTILIHPEYTLLIPNAFTPNPNGPSDGSYDITSSSNQVFFPFAEYVDEFEMFIFDRWGEQLFWSRNINEGWDGYFKGRMCQQDVYSYRVKVKFINGKRIQELGTLTLFR